VMTIGIDGPVGAGKSSVADAVARRLNILHLDTGAMYRALGLFAIRMGVDPGNEDDVVSLCDRMKLDVRCGEKGQETLLNDEDVSGLIRTPEVSMAASTVSRYAPVRKKMVAKQQELASQQDMVLDGRDICTTVLPNATLKVFLTASPEERARRRWKEMQAKGMTDTFEEVLRQVKERDEQDMNRPVEPLRKADDAILLDSSELDFDQVVEQITEWAEAKSHA